MARKKTTIEDSELMEMEDPEMEDSKQADISDDPDGNTESDETVTFISDKKKEMKNSQYRKRFDTLVQEVDANLINTAVSYGQKLYEQSGYGAVLAYTKTPEGNTDLNMYPQKLLGRDSNQSGAPVAQEPIAFSKILIATSVIGARIPDATVCSDSKVYSKVAYKLWKNTWTNRRANGQNTLQSVTQKLFTYGWTCWRNYPRRVQVKRKGVDKIIFDDIYREPMDPKRTWIGIGFSADDFFSQMEFYYERDMPKELFLEMYPAAMDKQGELDYCCGTSDESNQENNERQKTHVTIGYYENVLMNRYIVVCGKLVIYDGEIPNDDSYGSIMYAQCFSKNPNDPYGVGMYEFMRGNSAIFTYINSLNIQQIEGEISPILFGAQIQNGTATYKRGPNIINPKSPGSTIDIVRTTGNPQGGIQLADKQKADIEENTGINNIVAGQSSDDTLGGTVILREAALNRMVIPRNNLVSALEYDALITNSWIRQTYSVDKAFLLDSDEAMQEFIRQNPDYFMQSQPVIDDNDTFKGYAVVASPNLRLDFDFDEEGKLIENTEQNIISAKGLFDTLNKYGHTSHYIDFVIDPNSMLLPSKEIQKQQYNTMFPIIQNSLTVIFSLRLQDPQAAAAQLKTFEQLLEENKLNIYDYISKRTYDDIMSEQPSQPQIAMNQLNKQLNPEEEPGMTQQDGTEGLQPQSPEEMPTPQGPMGSSVDASLGYAASMPFTPNK